VNTNPGLIGTKLGNTQIFLDDGEVRRVTAIKAGPCVVVGKRTPDKDGYAALRLGFGSRRDKLVTKPEAGAFKAAGIDAPRIVREFRVDASLLERFEVGQTLGVADIFEDGQFVDVSGTSKGRGFTGVMKRHNFAGALLPEENIVLVDGGVPGPRNGFLTVKGAIKKAPVALPEPPAKEEPAGEAPEATEEG
jgi:large subunit ribosomal protein L3